MDVGKKLIKFRKDRNLTQEEVANSLGISKTKISKWERNQEIIDINHLSSICKLYGITPNDLLSDEFKKTNKKTEDNKMTKNIITAVVFVFYLYISFKTGAWYITWIIWVIYALINIIVKLINTLKGEKYEK